MATPRVITGTRAIKDRTRPAAHAHKFGSLVGGLSVSGDRPGSGEGLNEFILALTPSLVVECMKIVFSSRFDGSRFYRITVYTCCWPVGLICVEGSS